MRVRIEPLQFWFHDLCSCLQDCFGTVLLHHGYDPVSVLGAVWEFHYDPARVSAEEFYYPALRSTLGESLAPFHALGAVWREPVDGNTAWRDIRASLAAGRLAIAAVDNFFMPIRPAFGDVHAAHLVVVSGFDDEAGEVYVLESTPPQFHGAIAIDDFVKARGSHNEARPQTRDLFFAGSEISHRWIEIDVGADGPEVTPEWLHMVMASNLEHFRSAGLVELDGFLRTILDRTRHEDLGALGELYTVGWAMQSATALHADFLRQTGLVLGRYDVVELSRDIDRLANDWTALRIFGAHGQAHGHHVVDHLEHRARRLVDDHAAAVRDLERVVAG